MIVVNYNPPGEDVTVWSFEEDSWTVAEVKLIEKHSGMTRPEFFDAVGDGSDTARVLLLWVVRLRDEPSLRLGDLDDLLVSYLQFLKVQPADEEELPDPVNDPKDGPPGSSESEESSSTE